MSGTKKLLLACIAVAAVAAAVVVLRPVEGPDTAPEAAGAAQSGETAAALTVAVAAPEVATWPVEVQASGWLAAWQEVVISAEVGGQRVVAVNGDVGDTVQQGDLLVELSRSSLENSVLQLEAALESAQASLDNATADADRARQLSGGSSISQQQVAEYLATERTAKADVASAEAQLASARLDLEHARVTAVSGGVISERSVAEGAVVTAGEELFRLIRDGRVEWQAEVPLRQLRDIEVGTEVRIPTPLGEIAGEVRRIAPTASETNGRVIVYVSLVQPDGAVEPKTGIMITGVFKVGEREAVSVPNSAVVLQDGFSYIFTLQENGETPTVSRTRVETGRRQDDRVEITSALEEGVQVVQSGGAFLSDGAVVRVTDIAPVETGSAEVAADEGAAQTGTEASE